MPNLRYLLAAAALSTAAGAQTASQPMPTSEFVAAALGSDEYEIMAARVAMIASRTPEVRAFAQQMIADHGRTSASVQQAVTKSGMMPPPMTMSADQAHMLGALQSLAGPEFDKAYAHQQVLAHQQALVVEQGYAADGSDANLRQVAAAAVLVIGQHLQMAQMLVAKAGGS